MGRMEQLPRVEIDQRIVAGDGQKSESGLQQSALLLQKREHRRSRMHPVAPAGFRKAGAPGRAALAQRMVFGILPHPESQHDARFRTVRGSGHEQQKPHVGGLAVRIGGRAGLPGDLACLLEREGERPPFPLVRFHLPDRIAQGIHSRDDSASERRCRTRASDIKRSLQELGHRSGHRGMKEPLLWRTVFALDVAFLRSTLTLLVQKRLAVVADIVDEPRCHPKSTVHESGSRRHRQRIHLGCADRGRRVRLQDVLRDPGHAQAIREIDHVPDPGPRAGAHRRRVAGLSQRDPAGNDPAVLRLRPRVKVLDLLEAAPAAKRDIDRRVEHGAVLEHLGGDLLDRLRR